MKPGRTFCLPALLLIAQAGPALAGDFVRTDADGTKHIRAPFVNIDVKHHADGTKNVDVKAPFVKVHNPAGQHNAKIQAPFTKVDRTESGSPTVTAPLTKVERNPDGSARVKAPFTKVGEPNTAKSMKVTAPNPQEPGGSASH